MTGSTASMGGSCIIAGAAETDRLGKLPDHSTLQLHIEGAQPRQRAVEHDGFGAETDRHEGESGVMCRVSTMDCFGI